MTLNRNGTLYTEVSQIVCVIKGHFTITRHFLRLGKVGVGKNTKIKSAVLVSHETRHV